MKWRIWPWLLIGLMTCVHSPAFAHCGKAIAEPMLLSSTYRTGTQLSRFSQSREAFEAAKRLHSGARLDSTAAAIAFEQVAKRLTIEEKQRYFEDVFDLARMVENGDDLSDYWMNVPEPHRTRLRNAGIILTSGQQQRRLIGEWTPTPTPTPAPQVALKLVKQAVRDAALVRDLPENRVGQVATAIAKTRGHDGSAEIPGLTMGDVNVLATAAGKTRREVRDLARDLGEQAEDVQALRSALELPPGDSLDATVRKKAVDTISERLQEAQVQLYALGYKAPETADRKAWESVVSNFQSDYRLPKSGLLDKPTRDLLGTLYLAINNSRTLPRSDDPWSNFSADGKAPLVIPAGLESLTQVFDVPSELARQISSAFNDALGGEFITIRENPAASDRVLLAVTDSRNLNLSDSVAKMIRTDKIGVGLASNNGTAVFSATIRGTTLLQTSSNGVSEIVGIPASAWDRLATLLRLQRSAAVDPMNGVSIRGALKNRLRGRDVVVVEGKALAKIPIESMTDAQVIRSVIEGRPPEEVLSRVEGALAKRLRKSDIEYFNGAPSTLADFKVLESETQLRGNFEETWLPAQKQMEETLKKNGRTGKLRDVAKGLRDALSKRENVIVIVAHSSGEKIYFAEKGVLKIIGAADLESAREAIARNRPTVLLLSCSTGPKQDGTRTFGEALLDLGAGFVMAPTRDIGVHEVEDFISKVFRNPKDESLVEAVTRAMDETGTTGGEATLKMFVDLEAGWPKY